MRFTRSVSWCPGRLLTAATLVWSLTGCNKPAAAPIAQGRVAALDGPGGIDVTIDASTLTTTRLWLLGVDVFASDSPHTYTLTPGTYDLEQYDSGVDIGSFTVGDDGRISYDPSAASVLSLEDAHTLKLTGRDIVIDGTLLSEVRLYLGSSWVFDTAIEARLNVVPGSYDLRSYETNEDIGILDIHDDSTITYAQPLNRVLSGGGTNRVQLHGIEVTVDATRTPSPQRVQLAGIQLVFSSAEVQHLALLSGPYHLLPYDHLGDIGSFTLDANAAIHYDAGLEGILSGAGSNYLRVAVPYGAPDPGRCGVLASGEGLSPGQSIHSCNGVFTLTMKGDGELTYSMGSTQLYDFRMRVANSPVTVTGDNALTMQTDGDLTFITVNGWGLLSPGTLLWDTQTQGHPGAQLLLNDDGNLTIVWQGQTLWQSHTSQRQSRVTTLTAAGGGTQEFRFPDGYSVGIPTAQIATGLQQGTSQAVSVSEESTEVWLLDQDFSVYPQGVRPPMQSIDQFYLNPLTPRPFASFNAVKLPYLVAEGQPQTVTFDPPFPTRTVMSLDHGACYATVTYPTLAQQFEHTLFHSFVDGCDGVIYTEANVAPIFSPDLAQHLSWSAYLTGNPAEGGAGCIISVSNVAVAAQLTHALTVNHQQPFTNGTVPGNRVNVSEFNLMRGDQIVNSTVPDQGWPFNDCVFHSVTAACSDNGLTDFPKKFGGTINQQFVLPDINTLATHLDQISQKKKFTADQLNLCDTDADCTFSPLSPDDGCFHPNPGIGEKLNGDLVEDAVNYQGKGVCVTRLQPKRVNLTPVGIQVVLAENEQDQQIQLLKLMAKATDSVRCDAPPDPATPDMGTSDMGTPDMGGSSVAGQPQPVSSGYSYERQN